MPSGPSSPTLIVAPACIATHTCTLPSCDADATVSGTRSSVPDCTNTFSCTGASTMDPLLPAEATNACPGLSGPTWLASACSHDIVPSCGPKSLPLEKLTTMG